jgi:hypothetical protein
LTSGAVIALAVPATARSAQSATGADPSPTGNLQLTAPELNELDGAPNASTAGGDPLAQFQATLIQEFPNSYGGLVQNPDRTYTIMVVGNDHDLESTAQTLFDALPSEFGTTVPAEDLQLAFHFAAYSAATLYAIKQQIDGQISQTRATSAAGVYGTALDTWDSQVVVYSDVASPSNITTEQLTADYGSAVKLIVQPETSGQLLDRTNDLPPWSSGDYIVPQDNMGHCTLGWGVHSTSTNQHFSLTAGHCIVEFGPTWFNTTDGEFNKYTLIGTQDGVSTQGLDTAIIPDSSYYTMWQGLINSATMTTITGYADPPQGAWVCNEGSVSGQNCGYVKYTGGSEPVGNEQLQNEIVIDGTLNAEGGDSGGPLLYPSIFGPLAGGTEVGFSNTTGNNVFMEIDAILYAWSANFGQGIVVNTNAAP